MLQRYQGALGSGGIFCRFSRGPLSEKMLRVKVWEDERKYDISFG